MPLHKLRVEWSRSEIGFLQPLFNNWKARSVRAAGAPDWLRAIKVDNAEKADRTFEAFGYSFEVDVLWRLENECRVIELKNAWKYEPLALAEVLHHAFLLREREGDSKAIRSTIIGRYNPWTRAALKELRRHGLSEDQPEYLEFDHLRDATTEYLWFDSPLSAWLPVDAPPPALGQEVTDGWTHWYRVEHTRSWVGTRQAVAGGRPAFMTIEFTMVAAVEGRMDEFLVWKGTPPELGGASGHNWHESFERWTP